MTVEEAIAALEARREPDFGDGLTRYGIHTRERVIGMHVAAIQQVAKLCGRDHALAEALWETGVYEARMLAAFVGDPVQITPAQMDRWARDIDNWGTCDTLCFKLFDKSPHAFAMVDRWADDSAEFVKRTAFALLASLALHDKKCGDQPFLDRLTLIERSSTDERNFVKKGVNWALRAIDRRKSPGLRAATRELAERLATSRDKTARWVGKDALRAFTKADRT